MLITNFNIFVLPDQQFNFETYLLYDHMRQLNAENLFKLKGLR